MKNINEMIDVFKVECRCICLGRSKEEIVYEDSVLIIDNMETVKSRYEYMIKKCNALGYYANHDYWVRVRKCNIMENGIPDCGEIIQQHLKGDKE